MSCCKVDIQKVVEECVSALTDDFSVHPSGVIILWPKSKVGTLSIIPKREDDGKLWGWSLQITKKDSATDEAFAVEDAQKLVLRVAKWRWAQ